MKIFVTEHLHGYAGSAICARPDAGWIAAHPNEPQPARRRGIVSTFGADVTAESLEGASALIHCAYDFSLRDTLSARRVNVIGTRKLFIARALPGFRRSC